MTGPDIVTSREGRVSRNKQNFLNSRTGHVTSREGRVSRNMPHSGSHLLPAQVTSREGRVSRNMSKTAAIKLAGKSRPARGV